MQGTITTHARGHSDIQQVACEEDRTLSCDLLNCATVGRGYAAEALAWMKAVMTRIGLMLNEAKTSQRVSELGACVLQGIPGLHKKFCRFPRKKRGAYPQCCTL